MSVLSSLRPPDLALSDELRWVLLAAFAETPPKAPNEGFLRLIEPLAGRLGLAERIAARTTAREWPAALREPLHARLTRSVATCLLYQGLAHDIAELAGQRQSPVAYLKGLALLLYELSPAGSRAFADLDILVPPHAAEVLWSSLRERGFEPVDGDRTEQHLTGLRSPSGGFVEIHFALRGLLSSAGDPLTFDDLLKRGSVVPRDDFPGQSFLPTRDLLAAHVLAHGFQQHLLRPRTYPLFRMLTDLVDLLPGEEHWDHLATEWGASLADVASSADLSATAELCAALSQGRIPDDSGAGSAHRLLSHVVAGALDDAYATSLASGYLRARLSEASRRGELRSYLRRKLVADGCRAKTSRATLRDLPSRLARGLRRQLRAAAAHLRLGGRRR